MMDCADYDTQEIELAISQAASFAVAAPVAVAVNSAPVAVSALPVAPVVVVPQQPFCSDCGTSFTTKQTLSRHKKLGRCKGVVVSTESQLVGSAEWTERLVSAQEQAAALLLQQAEQKKTDLALLPSIKELVSRGSVETLLRPVFLHCETLTATGQNMSVSGKARLIESLLFCFRQGAQHSVIPQWPVSLVWLNAASHIQAILKVTFLHSNGKAESRYRIAQSLHLILEYNQSVMGGLRVPESLDLIRLVKKKLNVVRKREEKERALVPRCDFTWFLSLDQLRELASSLYTEIVNRHYSQSHLKISKSAARVFQCLTVAAVFVLMPPLRSVCVCVCVCV
jgi:hypothetical protein